MIDLVPGVVHIGVDGMVHMMLRIREVLLVEELDDFLADVIIGHLMDVKRRFITVPALLLFGTEESEFLDESIRLFIDEFFLVFHTFFL